MTSIEAPTDHSGVTFLETDTEFFPDRKAMSFYIGDKEVTFETGRMSRAATGSVIVKCEETMIMVNATVSEKPREGIDFFPLLIDVEEKMYSVGRMPGGYLKREGRPSEKATLLCRLIDRPIRPLFPEGYRNDIQIVAAPLCVDGINQYDMLCMVGASMALELTGAPFLGPIGAVRVGCIDDELIINPNYKETEEGVLDLVVAGTEESIMMVEAGANFVTEELLLEAMDYAHEEIKKQVQVQKEFVKYCGIEKQTFTLPYDLTPVKEFVSSQVEKEVTEAYHEFDRDKRKALLDTAKEKLDTALEEKPEEDELKKFLAEESINHVGETFKKLEKSIMRGMIFDEATRADGRKHDEIRPILAEVGIVPRSHGSALFTRGGTQALSIATLGAPGDAQRLDGVDPATEKRWMHHYAFPAYSVGEVRPMRGPGRREIGHGALAERANTPALPPKEEFPYALRVNSEILESNGSTSMASTCGTSLALMDAGVPVSCAIGGIAMGLIKEGDRYVILSDIQGIEDFLGDMDFKVTGNRKGITALQMDIKIQGISLEIMKDALEQARHGRNHILDKMAEAIEKPRDEMSPFAPKISMLRIGVEDIGTVIGPGGKTIRSIIERTGATIDIEDDGKVTITSTDQHGASEAQRIIEEMTRKLEPGLVIQGKVVRLLPIGAFVELSPGRDGMVHISELSNQRVNRVEDVVNVDDQVVVKIKEIDDRGRVNLSLKRVTDAEYAELGATKPDFIGERPEGGYEDRGGRPSGGGFRGGGDRGGRPSGGGGYRGGGDRRPR